MTAHKHKKLKNLQSHKTYRTLKKQCKITAQSYRKCAKNMSFNK